MIFVRSPNCISVRNVVYYKRRKEGTNQCTTNSTAFAQRENEGFVARNLLPRIKNHGGVTHDIETITDGKNPSERSFARQMGMTRKKKVGSPNLHSPGAAEEAERTEETHV